MQRQGHRARQPTHAIGRPFASEQTFRLSQPAPPQQTRRGERPSSTQFHTWRCGTSATIRWTGFGRAAAIDRLATSAFGRAL